MKTASWESEAKSQKFFKSKFGHRELIRKLFWSYLEFKNECSERFKIAFFSFFTFFSLTKWKPLPGKVRQSAKNFLNPNLVIGNLLENCFEDTLNSKTNVLSVSKWRSLVFYIFLVDKVKTASWESEAKCQKLFKSKFGHRKLIRKLFWSYLELKNECSERFKMALFNF